MSTTNNAAQTLFRFVSLRNPKLTETKKNNVGFVFRPEEVRGLFDTTVKNSPGRPKMQVLQAAAAGFESRGFDTEKEIEDGPFATLLLIGRKISKKQTLPRQEQEYTQNYYNELIDEFGVLKLTAIEDLEMIWNNLIYQVVTRKDFYVKEAIVQILKAIHLGFVQNLTSVSVDDFARVKEAVIAQAMEARVVLPPSLFIDEVSGMSIDGPGPDPVPLQRNGARPAGISDSALERLKLKAAADLAVKTALYRKTMLEKLEIELKKMQKAYYTAANKAYRNAYSEYQREYGARLDAYSEKADEIRRRINENTPEEEKQSLYQSLKELEAPLFAFSYKNEINLPDLQSKLTPGSFNLFIMLFSDVQADEIDPEKAEETLPEIVSDTEMRINGYSVQLDDSYDTFTSALVKIQSELSAVMDAAFENAPLPQQQYVNIGGALLPIIDSPVTKHLSYALCAYKEKSSFLQYRGLVNFSVEVENASWAVASARIVAETGTERLEESYGNLAVINNTVSFPAMLVNKFSGIHNLRIDISFTNGRDAYLELDSIAMNQPLFDVLELKNTTDTIDDTEIGKTTAGKHFGIKRLGIADYLKVVQSVHAYVPGEVSNIENVMASELRHKSSVRRDYSEVTDTTSSTEETERLSDTTKTSKTDMQTEVARELEKEQRFTAHTKFSHDTDVYKFEIGAEHVSNTSQHDSMKQAVTKSQEITERAMERVLTKITEERVQKIIREYTETNVHEFDNRGNGDGTGQHISGVYRWIDKKMKNQIYNYGKRTMFEFMVPEPARLHRLAFAVMKKEKLTPPVDPRTAPQPWTMATSKSATNDQLEHWAEIYGVSLTDLPEPTAVFQESKTDGGIDGDQGSRTQSFQIPQNYYCESISGDVRYVNNGGLLTNAQIHISNPGGGPEHYSSDQNSTLSFGGLNIQGTLTLSYWGKDLSSVNLNMKLSCRLAEKFTSAWRLENFMAIIKAYDEAYQKFQEAQAKMDAEAKAEEEEQQEKMRSFCRYMEADVLKHNCIAYLLQDYLHKLGINFTNGQEMKSFDVFLNDDLDQYAALAKFMEQAFEWTIMDYTFYPYYWAYREHWQEMYVSENVDPLFRSFLQAGMARVIVTVKPGFEDAVQFFLCTGKIWNGGEVPVIGDPLYLSIVDEMREPVGVPQGKYWITRMPTTLTILQDKSTGLPVDQPLPIFPESDPGNCENPSELEFISSFEQRDAQLQHSTAASTLPQNIINRG